MFIKKSITILAAIMLMSSAFAEKPLPKLVLTHVMGMMPAINWWGVNKMFPLGDYAQTKKVNDFALEYGGSKRVEPLGFMYSFLHKDSTYSFNEPYHLWSKYNKKNNPEYMVPYNPEYLQQRYKWDLEYADKMGIDGFGLCLSGNEPSRKHALEWFKTLEVMLKENPDINVRLTMAICGHEIPQLSDNPQKYKWLQEFMAEYKDSPAWLRHENRIILLGYHSQGSWEVNEAVDPQVIRKSVQAHKEFIKSLNAGNPIFIFDGSEYVPGQITHRNVKANPELLRPVVAEALKEFDAYACWGGVIPDEVYQDNYTVIADEVKRHNKSWVMPILDIHSGVGQFYRSKPGVERLIETWDMAEKTDAGMVQLVTWNDTAEATGFQPSLSLNYAMYSLTAKYIYKFKNGKFPEAKEDSVYLFYRKYHKDADPFLYPRSTVERDRDLWGETDDMLHVIVFAANSGKLKITGTSKGEQLLDLKKGYNEFKLKTAVNKEISASVIRGNKVVHKLVSPERVTDNPYREDLIPWGWSSDCRKLYDRDFGKDFYPVSYYSQRYNDGICDWFRLHYFGTTELKEGNGVNDDPDGDGMTNLQEFLAGDNPLKANPVYKPGYKWDELPTALDVIENRQFSARINFNPYPDKNGKLVHTFLYDKSGELDGNYPHMMKWVNKVSGTRTGWTFRSGAKHHYYKDGNGIAMQLLPDWAGIYRFWSPVNGKVQFKCTLNGDKNKTVKFCIKRVSSTVFSKDCPPDKTVETTVTLDLKRHDRIDFIVRSSDKATVSLLPEITLLEVIQK